MRPLAAILCCGVACYAAGGPQPPCGGEPVPAYPALNQAPVVKVWNRADWAPPACTGWAPVGSTTLVITVARFRQAEGTDRLRRRIGTVSKLADMLYWSTTNQRWQPLIVGAYALSGPDGDRRRQDFALDEVVEGRTLYAQQEDSLFGKAVYRFQMRAVSHDRLVFSTENVSPIRYLGIPVFQPGEIQSIYFLEREPSDVWRYYSMARTGAQMSLVTGGHEASLINRAVAAFRYLAGIPTDREPPAAR